MFTESSLHNVCCKLQVIFACIKLKSVCHLLLVVWSPNCLVQACMHLCLQHCIAEVPGCRLAFGVRHKTPCRECKQKVFSQTQLLIML